MKLHYIVRELDAMLEHMAPAKPASIAVYPVDYDTLAKALDEKKLGHVLTHSPKGILYRGVLIVSAHART